MSTLTTDERYLRRLTAQLSDADLPPMDAARLTGEIAVLRDRIARQKNPAGDEPAESNVDAFAAWLGANGVQSVGEQSAPFADGEVPTSLVSREKQDALAAREADATAFGEALFAPQRDWFALAMEARAAELEHQSGD